MILITTTNFWIFFYTVHIVSKYKNLIKELELLQRDAKILKHIDLSFRFVTLINVKIKFRWILRSAMEL